MYRCKECDTILKKKNITKHEQSKRHKYFSKLISNRYIMKDVEVCKFNEVFDRYFHNHMTKIDDFTITLCLKFDEDNKFKITVPNKVKYPNSYSILHYIFNTTSKRFSTRSRNKISIGRLFAKEYSRS